VILTKGGTAPITYDPLKMMVTSELADLGFTPTIAPGPVDANSLKLSPDDIVFLMLGSGPGLSLDGLYDRVILTTRCIGKQNDYDQAEALALALDQIMRAFATPLPVGLSRSLYFTRTGGRPTEAPRDDADRYHFTCSYITEATTGL
jgi:hypothetical protein